MICSAVEAVVFDAFGTIVRIGHRFDPYLELFREARRQGVSIVPRMSDVAMTLNLSFDELASHLRIDLTPLKRERLNRDLQLELASVQAFPDAHAAVHMLQSSGIKVGVCSNLAAPYGPKIRELFPRMDGYAFSYELGVTKPEPSIYQAVCSQMNVEPGHYFSQEKGRVVMIGDSRRFDQDGARAVRVMGILLDRSGRTPIRDLEQLAKIVVDHNGTHWDGEQDG